MEKLGFFYMDNKKRKLIIKIDHIIDYLCKQYNFYNKFKFY